MFIVICNTMLFFLTGDVIAGGILGSIFALAAAYQMPRRSAEENCEKSTNTDMESSQMMQIS